LQERPKEARTYPVGPKARGVEGASQKMACLPGPSSPTAVRERKCALEFVSGKHDGARARSPAPAGERRDPGGDAAA